MIGEVLAGAALIKSSVTAIKGAIGTAKDVGEIASFIDNIFLGKAQLEKQQQSANSLNSVAKDMINAELAKEAETQVRLMVNMRFGSKTWDRIVAERSRRVKAAAGEMDWNPTWAEGAQSSWKDEWLTILVSIPLILAFTGYEDVVMRGFTALEAMPDYYKTAVGVVFAASFGIQSVTKMFKK